MNNKSKASLFLIEKLIVIVVFAICAAACADIFVESYLMANDSRDMNFALTAAKNGAELYKSHEDLFETAKMLGGKINADSGSAVVYYDSGWQVSGIEDAEYIMRIRQIDDAPPFLSELSIGKIGGEEILSFTVAARSTTASREKS